MICVNCADDVVGHDSTMGKPGKVWFHLIDELADVCAVCLAVDAKQCPTRGGKCIGHP